MHQRRVLWHLKVSHLLSLCASLPQNCDSDFDIEAGNYIILINIKSARLRQWNKEVKPEKLEYLAPPYYKDRETKRGFLILLPL
jgi:hypothetical protein